MVSLPPPFTSAFNGGGNSWDPSRDVRSFCKLFRRAAGPLRSQRNATQRNARQGSGFRCAGKAARARGSRAGCCRPPSLGPSVPDLLMEPLEAQAHPPWTPGRTVSPSRLPPSLLLGDGGFPTGPLLRVCCIRAADAIKDTTIQRHSALVSLDAMPVVYLVRGRSLAAVYISLFADLQELTGIGEISHFLFPA